MNREVPKASSKPSGQTLSHICQSFPGGYPPLLARQTFEPFKFAPNQTRAHSPPHRWPLMRSQLKVPSGLQKLVATGALLIVLCSCTNAADQTTAESTTTSQSIDLTTSTSVVEQEPGCVGNTRNRLQNVISSQINALDRGAFEEARSFASPSFRENVGPSEFQSIIQSGFPFLLSENSAAFGRCKISDGTATVEVRFDTSDPVTLIYFLIRSENEWWIDGASPAVDSLSDKVGSL